MARVLETHHPAQASQTLQERSIRYFEDKLEFSLGPLELKEKLDHNQVFLVDVRRKEDYEKEHIPQAISIPKNDLEEKLGLLLKDRVTVVYCYSQQCHLAARAALILAKNGYPVMELEGGIDSWKNDYGFPLES